MYIEEKMLSVALFVFMLFRCFILEEMCKCVYHTVELACSDPSYGNLSIIRKCSNLSCSAVCSWTVLHVVGK